MWRYLVGMLAGVVLVGGGVLWWRSAAIAGQSLLPGAPRAALTGSAGEEVPEPPEASEKTREQRRFNRYDHDKDGKVTRDEYLAARHKAFVKLDVNNDGRLTFDEWAIKAETKFADADKDKSSALSAAEFATTKVQRKTKAPVRCPPASNKREDDEG